MAIDNVTAMPHVRVSGPDDPNPSASRNLKSKLKSPSKLHRLLTIHLANCQFTISCPKTMASDLQKQFGNILQTLSFASVVNHGSAKLSIKNSLEEDQSETRTGVLNAVASLLVQDNEVLAVSNTSRRGMGMGGIISVSAPGLTVVPNPRDEDDHVDYILERSLLGGGLNLTIIPNARDGDERVAGAYIPKVKKSSNWDDIKATDMYARAAE